MFTGRDPEAMPRVVLDEADLQTILEDGHADLQVIHHGEPNFKHYDVVALAGRRVGLPEAKQLEIVDVVRSSALLTALAEGDVDRFRREALALVGGVKARW